MKPSSARNTAAARRRLLELIRWQSRCLSHGFLSRDTAPELFDLAIAAKYERGRSMMFHGIRFPLKHGYFVSVRDPVTGEALVGAGGILS